MSTRRIADKPPDAPEPDEGTEPVDTDEAVEDEVDELDAQAEAFEAYGADTGRLEAYGPVLEILCAANGLPVVGGGDNAVVASQSCVNVTPKVSRKAERTLLAVLDDIYRIATSPGQPPVLMPNTNAKERS